MVLFVELHILGVLQQYTIDKEKFPYVKVKLRRSYLDQSRSACERIFSRIQVHKKGKGKQDLVHSVIVNCSPYIQKKLGDDYFQRIKVP